MYRAENKNDVSACFNNVKVTVDNNIVDNIGEGNNVKDNKNTKDYNINRNTGLVNCVDLKQNNLSQYTPCFCFLSSSEQICKMAHSERRDDNVDEEEELKDERTEVEMMKDIIATLEQNVSQDYKAAVDSIIQRDSSIKEVIEGECANPNEIKKMMSDFKKKIRASEIGNELVKDIHKQNVHNLNTQVQVEMNTHTDTTNQLASIHGIFINPGNQKRLNLRVVIDTACSHFTIPAHYMNMLGIKEEELDNKNSFVLNTTSKSNDQLSVLGSAPIILSILDRDATEHKILVQTLFVKSPLDHGLISMSFLRKFKFKIDFGPPDYLKLSLGYRGRTKYFSFPIINLEPHFNQTLINLHKIEAISNIPKKIIFRGKLEKGKHIIKADSFKTQIISILEKPQDNMIYSYPIYLSSNEDRIFRPGEIEVQCKYLEDRDEHGTLGKKPILKPFKIQSQEIEDGDWSQDPELGTAPRTPGDQGHHQVLQGGEGGQHGLDPGARNTGAQEDVNIFNTSIQDIRPDKLTEYSDDEFSRLNDIVISEGDEQEMVFKKCGIYPKGQEEVVDLPDDLPDFGIATKQEIEELMEIFKLYPCWSKSKYDTGSFQGFEADLPTIDDLGIHQEQERVHTRRQYESVEPLIQALLENGVLEEADPTRAECWSSNFLVQRKGSAKLVSKGDKIQARRERKERGNKEDEEKVNWRLLIDMRGVNKRCKPKPSPTYSTIDSISLRAQGNII